MNAKIVLLLIILSFVCVFCLAFTVSNMPVDSYFSRSCLCLILSMVFCVLLLNKLKKKPEKNENRTVNNAKRCSVPNPGKHNDLIKLGQHIAYNGIDGLNCTCIYSIIHANSRKRKTKPQIHR